jgi:hypothetical protein
MDVTQVTGTVKFTFPPKASIMMWVEDFSSGLFLIIRSNIIHFEM